MRSRDELSLFKSRRYKSVHKEVKYIKAETYESTRESVANFDDRRRDCDYFEAFSSAQAAVRTKHKALTDVREAKCDLFRLGLPLNTRSLDGFAMSTNVKGEIYEIVPVSSLRSSAKTERMTYQRRQARICYQLSGTFRVLELLHNVSRELRSCGCVGQRGSRVQSWFYSRYTSSISR